MAERLVNFHAAVGGKSFVGIKFCLNTIDVYYPETFHWDNDEVDLMSSSPTDRISESCARGIRNILASLVYAKTLSREKTMLNDEVENDGTFAMKAYMWMIRDYMSNGVYKNTEITYKYNQNGRINWKRTLCQKPIYANGAFVYKDVVVSARDTADTMLTRIYRFCLRKSMFLIGWLFNIRSSSLGVSKMEDVVLSDGLKKHYLYVLRNELNRTFDDIKRDRLRNMLSIVEGLNKAEQGQLVYGVDSFHYVFERMIDKIYGTETNLEPYFPYGVWSNGKNASPLYPDSICKRSTQKEDIYVIIDAKCYRYADEGYSCGDIKGLPATDSIQKQLTYADHLSRRLCADERKATIYNCFIIPYDRHKQYGNQPKSDDMLLSTGLFATGTWRNEKPQCTYERIYVFLADMRTVIETWSRNDHDMEQGKLVGELRSLFIEKRY